TRRPPRSPLVPYTPLFRSPGDARPGEREAGLPWHHAHRVARSPTATAKHAVHFNSISPQSNAIILSMFDTRTCSTTVPLEAHTSTDFSTLLVMDACTDCGASMTVKSGKS